MHIDRTYKFIVISYARNLLSKSSPGALDQAELINAGDEALIRGSLEARRAELSEEAKNAASPTQRESLESQADSVQEVLDSLAELLNA